MKSMGPGCKHRSCASGAAVGLHHNEAVPRSSTTSTHGSGVRPLVLQMVATGCLSQPRNPEPLRPSANPKPAEQIPKP